MAYVGFDDDGYEYFTEGRYVLFSSDNNHYHLFDYITEDLSGLPKLLEQYVSARMDTTTFEPKECKNGNDDLNEIIEILKSAHPYFEHEYAKEIRNEIGSYFNELLVYTVFNQNEGLYEYSVQEDWYTERLSKLIPSTFLYDDSDYKDFFKKFFEWVDKKQDVEETAYFGKPEEKPKGFTNEIMTQEAISNMLYFILDILAPEISNLNTPQRMWLYGNIFNHSGPMVSATQNLSFMPPIRFRGNQDRSQEAEYLGKMYDVFEPLRALNRLNAGCDGIPADMAGYLSSAIKYADNLTEIKIYEEYEVRSLRELLYLEVMTMIRSGTMIRKCRNCGRYFIVSNRKTAYCNRMTESGFPCSTVGPGLSFHKKVENEEALKIYTRAYKTHFARTKSTKKKRMTPEEFSAWCDEAKEKLEQARRGEIELDEFQKWLKD